MSYVMMNGKKFTAINEAVMEAEENAVKSAEIVIYDNGVSIETQEITAEDGYKYRGYAVFEECGDNVWRWWGNCVCYNTQKEACSAIIQASPSAGSYKIVRISLTLNGDGDEAIEEDIAMIDLDEKEKDVFDFSNKTSVICEQCLFTLRYSDYNDSNELEVFSADLKNADVGTVFDPDMHTACGRAVHDETLEIIYKIPNGVAALFRVEGTSDEPNPRNWEREPELIWFELK